MSRISSIFRLPKKAIKYSTAPKSQDEGWESKLRKYAFHWSGYNKYGLYTDDIIDDDIPAVREALRRLPKDVKDARNFRLIRGLQLSFLKIHLPKEKWITYEQDLNYRYLWPYIVEVENERTEIYKFGCVNYSDNDWPANERN